MKETVKLLVAVPELEEREDLLAEIAAISPRLVVEQQTCRSMPEVTAALGDAEILYTLWFPETVEPDSGLRWVQMTSTGVDNKLSHPVFDPGNAVVVTSAAGCHAVPIAEYSLFAMGLLARGLMGFYRDQQQKVRERSHSTLTDLWGQTVGIVGYGHIGREVARLAKSFNMRVLATKRHPDRRKAEGFELAGVGDPDGSLADEVLGPEDLPKLLARSDFVVSTVPLTPVTANLFDDAAFAAMKPSAYFVNVSRGGVVDHDALVRALDGGSIQGACLDVLFTDPKPLPPEHPLWSLDNVLLTPHVAGNRNPDYMRRAQDLLLTNLTRYLNDEPLLNAVTREKGY
ncbi:MAG: hydroxyacid dehydrogenase [Dehalococcoidia bacterium]|nr:hydroxyacid dehydrogenase [Dehalococcoidia bacterium]